MVRGGVGLGGMRQNNLGNSRHLSCSQAWNTIGSRSSERGGSSGQGPRSCHPSSLGRRVEGDETWPSWCSVQTPLQQTLGGDRQHTSVSLMISPELRHNFLLSSSTVFMFSIQTASTGPSNMYHFLLVSAAMAPARMREEKIPSVL